MEFEFTATIYINLDDLRQMYLRVKNGESFYSVYDDIMGGYDDFEYYCSGYIRDQVKEEINRRLAQAQKNY